MFRYFDVRLSVQLLPSVISCVLFYAFKKQDAGNVPRLHQTAEEVRGTERPGTPAPELSSRGGGGVKAESLTVGELAPGHTGTGRGRQTAPFLGGRAEDRITPRAL